MTYIVFVGGLGGSEPSDMGGGNRFSEGSFASIVPVRGDEHTRGLLDGPSRSERGSSKCRSA